jgi:hypothetical protein
MPKPLMCKLSDAKKMVKNCIDFYLTVSKDRIMWKRPKKNQGNFIVWECIQKEAKKIQKIILKNLTPDKVISISKQKTTTAPKKVK